MPGFERNRKRAREALESCCPQALRNEYDVKGCFLVWKCCDFPEETESLQQSRSERQQGLLAAQQFLLPGRHVCKAHLYALMALELEEVSFEGSSPPELTLPMKGHVLKPRQRLFGCPGC